MTKTCLNNPQKNIRLRELRESAGLSQEALGQKIGITGMAVSHIETGRRQMSANMAKKFSEFFGCSTDYLLCTDGADNTDTITCEAAKIVALAGKIISRPALTELFTVAQGVDDDMLEAVTEMLRTYIQRKDLKEHYKEERKND